MSLHYPSNFVGNRCSLGDRAKKDSIELVIAHQQMLLLPSGFYYQVTCE